MATATGLYVADNSSLTNFKSWSQSISNAFSTFGWTQTSDTGQVNWSTIVAVPSSNYVYEIWKANDTQASTCPIYVKIEYGFNVSNVAIRLTVGTGSNGSGTITSILAGYSAFIITNNAATFANQGITTYNCFFSGDAGEIRVCMWQGLNSPAGMSFFGIERSKDTSGNKTDDYFTVCHCNATTNTGNTAHRQQTMLKSGLTPGFEGTWIGVGCSTQTNSGSFNSTVAAFPVFPLIGKIGNPMLGLMIACANDILDGATVTVASMYGSTHTYVALKSGGVGTPGFQSVGMYTNQGTQMGVLMRYE
jgi:hypothetical protein